MKTTQREQIFVELENKEKGNDIILRLENNGYTNVQNLSFDSLKIKVIIIDVTAKTFFGTSVTSIACSVSSGNHPVSIDNFKQNI